MKTFTSDFICAKQSAEIGQVKLTISNNSCQLNVCHGEWSNVKIKSKLEHNNWWQTIKF